MSECQNLTKCKFFQNYENEEKLRLALGGFVRVFCKGEKQESCVRKKVSKALGGADKVPVNMMPNGFPLSGTDSSKWSNEVNEIVKSTQKQ